MSPVKVQSNDNILYSYGVLQVGSEAYTVDLQSVAPPLSYIFFGNLALFF